MSCAIYVIRSGGFDVRNYTYGIVHPVIIIKISFSDVLSKNFGTFMMKMLSAKYVANCKRNSNETNCGQMRMRRDLLRSHKRFFFTPENTPKRKTYNNINIEKNEKVSKAPMLVVLRIRIFHIYGKLQFIKMKR